MIAGDVDDDLVDVVPIVVGECIEVADAVDLDRPAKGRVAGLVGPPATAETPTLR